MSAPANNALFAPEKAVIGLKDTQTFDIIFGNIKKLSWSDPISEYRSGDENITVREIPGLKKFAAISFKRGIMQDTELWNWCKTFLDGTTERKSGSIIVLNEAREPALRWNFREGWPTKWEGPSLNATGGELAIETLEIAYEGLDLELA